jgi:hypothetical protein
MRGEQTYLASCQVEALETGFGFGNVTFRGPQCDKSIWWNVNSSAA